MMSDQMNNERDVVVSRIIDAQAGPADWSALREMVEQDAGVWRELGEAQRIHTALCRGVEMKVAAADGVEAPVVHASVERLNQRVRIAATWGGWAAAAAVAVAWTLGVQSPTGRGELTGGSIAGLAGSRIGSAADAFREYMSRGQESGEVITELPSKVLLQASPSTSGQGYEVVYLRQIMERRQVPTLLQFSQDETGRGVLVPASGMAVRGGAM